MSIINVKCEPFQSAQNLAASGATGHILGATHGRFDHAVAIRAFRHMHCFTVIGRNRVMLQFLATGSTGHAADTHSADFTFIC